MSCTAAKHLEPLKGGKVPVEILVTAKDPEQKKKAFDQCLEAIKTAGVCLIYKSICGQNANTQLNQKRKKSACYRKTRVPVPLQMIGNVPSQRYQEKLKKPMSLLLSLRLLFQ